MHYLWWAVMVASVYGGVQWFLHERPVRNPPGILVADTPQIVLRSSRAPWEDAHGFKYSARADLEARLVVVARANYSMGEFAGFSPTDLAVVWGSLSNRSMYEQFKFSEMGSPLSGRFVFPEVRAGSDMAKLPFGDVADFLLLHLTHIHTIPGSPSVAKTLASIRPGQIVHLHGVLVDAMTPSRTLYRTSLKLFDYDCEIMWVDAIELE